MSRPFPASRTLAALLLLGAVVSCQDSPREAITAPRSPALAHAASGAPKPAVVLVHGAWADGSGWADVMRALQRQGYTVTAVQNALHSVEGDIETTRRVIVAQQGPVIVVAHSYGGAVITGAAAGLPNVKALVYVAAFAPDAGEILGQLVGRLGPSDLDAALRPDAAGYLYLDRAMFHDVFAGDLPRAESDVLAAVQKPVNSAIFGQQLAVAAWRTIPSWYLLARDDHTIKPALQRFMSARMGARVTEIEASHLVFISHPQAVVRMIDEAAAATAP